MRGRGAAAALVLGAVLTACNGGDPPPTVPTDPPPSSTSSSSTTSTPPTTTAPSGAPVLPDAAKAQTPAGAEAFVRHWFDTIGYSITNLDSAPLLALGECLTCQAFADTIEGVAGRGNRLEGGETTVSSIEPSAAVGETTSVTAAFTAGEAREVRRDGSLVEVVDPGGEQLYLFTLTWSQQWQASAIQTVE